MGLWRREKLSLTVVKSKVYIQKPKEILTTDHLDSSLKRKLFILRAESTLVKVQALMFSTELLTLLLISKVNKVDSSGRIMFSKLYQL